MASPAPQHMGNNKSKVVGIDFNFSIRQMLQQPPSDSRLALLPSDIRTEVVIEYNKKKKNTNQKQII